jgi:E3 ubiquitin-protein ligase UBR4
MRIVYGMRGLLRDATEEFIEHFDDKHQRPANDEETYRLANVMGECGGLDVLLERLSCVREIQGEGRPLLGALVKLLSFCTKVQTKLSLMITPELNAICCFLSASMILNCFFYALLSNALLTTNPAAVARNPTCISYCISSSRSPICS